MNKTKYLKYAIFSLVIVLIVSSLTYFQRPENQANDTFIKDKLSPDVLFLGSSHGYCNFNGAVIWNQYGIPVYSLAQGEQPICMTYYILKGALRNMKQKPKVAVLDVYMCLFGDERNNSKMENHIAKALYSFPFWTVIDLKIEASYKFLPRNKFIDYALGYPVYHTEYKNVIRNIDNQSCGFIYNKINKDKKYSGTHYSIDKTTSSTKISPTNEEYLLKIFKLCKDNNINLELVFTPCFIKENDFKMIKYVNELAEKNGVDFVDLNSHINDIGIDIEGDGMIDDTHCTYIGAEQNSIYYGKYLSDKYSLENKKGNENYSYWDNSYKNFLKNKAIFEKQQ